MLATTVMAAPETVLDFVAKVQQIGSLQRITWNGTTRTVVAFIDAPVAKGADEHHIYDAEADVLRTARPEDQFDFRLINLSHFVRPSHEGLFAKYKGTDILLQC